MPLAQILLGLWLLGFIWVTTPYNFFSSQLDKDLQLFTGTGPLSGLDKQGLVVHLQQD